MHDIRWIADNAGAFDKALARRGLPGIERMTLINSLVSLDERRRAAIQKLEAAQAFRRSASKKFEEAKRHKDEATARAVMAEVAELKTAIPKMERSLKDIEAELDKALAEIPNLPADDVPDGADASANVEHHRFGAKKDYAFTPKQHFELGEALGQMDFETAAKLSGARFVVLKSGLARLERALGQFMLDVHTREHGYTEVAPPLLVRDEVMFGTAQLPKFRDDQFPTENKLFIATGDELNLAEALFGDALTTAVPKAFKDQARAEEFQAALRQGDWELYQTEKGRRLEVRRGLWLIPTAEVPLTNLVRESIVEEAQLPMRLTACTPCFRAEAGAAGKDTRGMLRQHQFTKVELVSITTPEQSKDEHERMLACAEEVLRRLDLHYRVVTLCAGDMGFAAEKTYDIEVWLPGQGAYREISSCSNCGPFQARRMQARYRAKEGKTVRPVHTLNGSGVAVGRALIAVMETCQQADGSIAVPDALQAYMGGTKTIERTA